MRRRAGESNLEFTYEQLRQTKDLIELQKRQIIELRKTGHTTRGASHQLVILEQSLARMKERIKSLKLEAQKLKHVHVGNSVLGQHHCHMCAFFNNADEQHRALNSFIKEGLERGEKILLIVNPDLRKDSIERLSQDMDVEQAVAGSQLDLLPWAEAHLRGGDFKKEAMLILVEELLAANKAAGYPLTRIVAAMEWALLDKPGVGDLIEYESRVNEVLSRHYAPVICTYDLSKFGASVVMDVLRAHPVAIVGGVLHENPFYVPPNELLVELRERKATQKGAYQLQ